MKQVVQNYNDGDLTLADVPAPICKPGGVLVRTAYSLVSAGTERMKVEQARMSLIAKARARPDKVKQVIQSVKQNGLLETYRKVSERLDALTPLGYSAAGYVVEVGRGVDEFRVGDRVACAGEAIACHAEFISVPRNLCVHVPDDVDLKDAAFSTVGAIAINGVRQSSVTLGDTVVVLGLGLIGLLAVQILKAAGCRVIGVDFDAARVALARHGGADVALTRDDAALDETIRQATGGRGPDVVYISASTQSTDPMDLAGRVVRDRGRIVIVGMVKMEADWRTYYGKEVSVVMARSYGPGRYDRNYEQKGIDYPVGYVPWTQRRNLEEFVRLVQSGLVSSSRLGPKVYKIDEAETVYEQLSESPGGEATGILFEYPKDAPLTRKVTLPCVARTTAGVRGGVSVALLGAGNFATGTLIPALKRIPAVRLSAICSAGGLSATSAAKRHGFGSATSDVEQVLVDPGIHALVIATRHDSHARFAAQALRAGKHVYVEKPLALTDEQLDELQAAQAETGRVVMAGYNRRYSPLSIALREHFATRAGPIEVLCRVNAGALGSDSWYQDADEGGWRIVSEGCHFVDLISFICGCAVERIYAEMVGGAAAGQQNDNCTLTLKMEDGSLGTLVYVANGDPCYEKERIEVFGQGRTGIIENFRIARLFSKGKVRTVKPDGTGKGHHAALAAFIAAIQEPECGGFIPDSAVRTTQVTFRAAEALVGGAPIGLI